MSRIYWIAEYGATFSEFFLSTIFCETFIENSNHEKKLFRRIFASVIAAALILTTNHIKLYSPITAVIGFVSIALLQIVICPESKIKAVIRSLIYLLLIAMVDSIIVSMLSYAFHIPATDIYEEMSLYRLVALFFFMMLFLIIVIFFGAFKLTTHYGDQQ